MHMKQVGNGEAAVRCGQVQPHHTIKNHEILKTKSWFGGSFSDLKGHRGLYFLPRNSLMNSDHYIHIDDEKLVLDIYEIHELVLLMQDSTAGQKSRKAMKWPAGHNIAVLD